tara:strand:+ start:2487 stop:3287 length:801 start_codon:yes stop_codon:yes gene_type:complete
MSTLNFFILKITAIQSDIFWESSKRNIDFLQRELLSLDSTDLIVLPEMFSTGFSMNVNKIAEPIFGNTFNWMKRMAKELEVSILGSIPTVENNKFYNRLYVVNPEGFSYYDKKHLFSMAHEDLVYTHGSSELIIELKGFKIKPLICYDLRFPVWSRNRLIENTYDYDLLIYIANWPSVRSNVWRHLLKARAIENLSYVMGVNRVGVDGNGIKYDGSSRVFDFKGERLDQFKDDVFFIQNLNLEKKKLDEFRTNFPALNDADIFSFS